MALKGQIVDRVYATFGFDFFLTETQNYTAHTHMTCVHMETDKADLVQALLKKEQPMKVKVTDFILRM